MRQNSKRFSSNENPNSNDDNLSILPTKTHLYGMMVHYYVVKIDDDGKNEN